MPRNRLRLLHVVLGNFVTVLLLFIVIRISSVQYFDNKFMEFDHFYVCIYMENIKVGIAMLAFSQISSRVIALD